MPRWYVAKVKPRNEHSVQTYLGQYGVDVYAPEIAVIKQGRQRVEPVFPGYVFVRSDPLSQEWPLIRWARGLSYLLPDQREPTPMADSLVEELDARVIQWNAGGWVAAFQPGDRVLIETGPLRTLEGIFQRYVPGNQRCEVLVSLIGRPQRVQVDITGIYCAQVRSRFAGLE